MRLLQIYWITATLNITMFYGSTEGGCARKQAEKHHLVLKSLEIILRGPSIHMDKFLFYYKKHVSVFTTNHEVADITSTSRVTLNGFRMDPVFPGL